MLAGTAPQGGPDLHRWSDDVYAHAAADEPTPEHALHVFFSGSEESRAKGMEYLQRTQSRQDDRDEPTDLATRDAQLAAITAWGIPDSSKLNRLAGIIQPTFVAIGDNDTMMHTKNSQLLADQTPQRPPPDLRRREPRLPQPVPGAVRRPRQHLSQRPLEGLITAIREES